MPTETRATWRNKLAHRRRQLGLDGVGLAMVLACAGAFSLWTLAVTGALSPGALVLFLCLPISFSCYGNGITSLAGIAAPRPLVLAAGSLIFALLVLGVKAICPCPLA